MSLVQDPRVPPAQLEAAASTFDLLSVPGRLHLVVLLAGAEYAVSTLADLTGAAVPAASQQLAKLRAAGVVTARRDGRRQLSQVKDPHILSVIEPMLGRKPAPASVLREPAAILSPAAPARGDSTGAVLEALGPSPVEIDELIRFTGLKAGEVQLALIELDLAGRIERHPGQRVSLV